MTSNNSDLRKRHERDHGKFLVSNAVEIWGWGTPAGKVRAQRRAQLLIEHAKITSQSRVLDYGCGTGMFSRLIAETGAVVTAIDLSPDLLSAAEKESHPKITFQIGDIESLTFSDSSFSAVIGSSVLHHVQIEKALSEAFRVLQPGGYVAFAEPNMLNPQIALQKNIPYIKRKMGDSPDETAFFRWSAERYLRKTGFIDINIRPHDFLHPLIPAQYIPFFVRLSNLLEVTPVIREIAGSLLFCGRKPS